MSRKLLPREIVKCHRSGCNNTVIKKVGATYQPQYCSPYCAHRDKQGKKCYKTNQAKNEETPIYKEKLVTLKELIDMTVVYDDKGGKFGKTCDNILRGEVGILTPWF